VSCRSRRQARDWQIADRGPDGYLRPAGQVVLKAVYTAALGFAVTRWVILRRANSTHTD
jgi:hypothetical protein